MNDLISREAAIDALGEKPLAWTDSEYELALQQQWESDVDAIKALPSAQPDVPDTNVGDCSDCIKHGGDWECDHIHCRKGRLPSAQPEQQWIPCSERLPEENGRYLVTRGLNACGALWNRAYIINYSDLMGLKSERIWWNGNVGKSDFERIDDVVAWMPLPKPWRGEQDG